MCRRPSRRPKPQRTPGQVLLANQVIRTVSAGSAEIDRIMKPEDLRAKKELLARSCTDREGKARADPDGDGHHRRRLPLYARRSRRRTRSWQRH